MRMIEIKTLWIGAATWFALDCISAIWRTAPHVAADITTDIALLIFVATAHMFSHKVKS